MPSFSSRWLTCILSRVEIIQSASRSVPTTSFAPSFKATIERIPLPQPTSSTVGASFAPSIYLISCLIQSCVVSCFPVPKEIPGSISIINLSASSGFTSSHVGLINISPIVNDEKYFFQLLIQSRSSVSDDEITPLPTSTVSLKSSSPSFTFLSISD